MKIYFNYVIKSHFKHIEKQLLTKDVLVDDYYV